MNKSANSAVGSEVKAPFDMPEIALPNIPERSVAITDFGACGDGITMNTEAIARAIEAVAADGGGTVIIPSGVWLTGPIVLKSHIRLHTEHGAVIRFSTNYTDYPLIESNFEGLSSIRCMSPLYGEQLEDVAITGNGIFDGSGDAWRPVKRFKMTELQWKKLINSGGVVDADGEIWWPTEAAMNGAVTVEALRKQGSTATRDYEPVRSYLRPVLLSLRNCSRILLDGPTFQNSPGWCLHPWVSEHITIRNITVRNPWYSQNGDGLDLESCRYAEVSDSVFDVGDDAICIKSGKNEQGRKLGKPCEYVVVRDCTVYHGHGGFVIGSEMSGGVRNLLVSNCSFIGTDVGLRFKSTRGRGGVVEHVYIRNIRMKDIAREAITFNMYYEVKGDPDALAEINEGTPQFRDIFIEDTVCAGADIGIQLKGLPEMPIRSIHLNRVSIEAKQAIECTNAENISLREITVVPEQGPVVRVHNSKNILLEEIVAKTESEIFMHVTGDSSEQIRCTNTSTALSKESIVYGAGVKEGAVQV
ncbi:glycoside hydrolase family 28 protein [Paenibacillus sp. UNC451MF]|uniref:glycoside hydrolase family 28 protein n=1 Tax=Paenibacillus sp. UNC451MF TaxID=1449063 RepID=UPI00048AF468|nr:glycoside hydrolase family 28 protein [Paenibacillus sp. UNC451MF]